jgi:serine/threonine protein kinase
MEEGNSHLPTTSASNDGKTRENEDQSQEVVSEPELERASSSQEFSGLGRLSGPLSSYHRGTAIRMLTDYLSDLTTLNISLDEDIQKRVEENRAFLIDLSEANQREPNSPLTWQERAKLSLMLKDYQKALSAALEDQDDEEDAPDVTDVEFKDEKGEADGVPLTLYEANFSGGGYVESLISALDLCETHVREFKKLLPVVGVFQQQCKHLVETLEPTAKSNFDRCHKALEALKRLEVDEDGVFSSSRRNSVHFCFESLVGLVRKLQLVVNLFRKCASENLHKTALQLADLPPPPLMPKRWSEFSLAIRNCEWSMDLVEFAFYTLEKLLAGNTHIFQDVSFKWCEEKSRMVLNIQGKLGRLDSGLEKLGRQDSRPGKSLLEISKELEKQDMEDLIDRLGRVEETANGGAKWKLSGFLSKAAYDRANVTHFLREKLSGPIPHARYLPWTFRVDPGTLKFREYLDSGGAGMVGKYTWFGENVAVKNVRSPGLTRHKFEEEAAILATVQHPNVVRFIGCGFLEKNKTGMLVMELMDHDLRTVIESRVEELGPGSIPFSTIVAIDIILQIAQAMRHLKDHKVLHRDLKAKNILVNIYEPLNSGGESNTSLMQRQDVSLVLPHTQENYVAKLADFGLAKCRPHSSWVHTRMAGTTGWRAPEVFHVHDTEVTQEYKWPADVYSFAMTCYEILTGSLPFANSPNQSIHASVMAGKRPEGLDELNIPDLLKDLVKKCWATDPDERPTFDEIERSLWECRVKAIVPGFERQICVSRSASNLSARH